MHLEVCSALEKKLRVTLGDTLTLLSCLETFCVHPKLDGHQLTMNQLFHNNLVSPISLKACRGAFHCSSALLVCVRKIIEHAENVSKSFSLRLPEFAGYVKKVD